MLHPAPAQASTRTTRRLVFSCVTPGLITFSDRPCGPAPAIRELQLDPAATKAGRAVTVAPEPPRDSVRDATAREADNERPAELEAMSDSATTCERLEAAVQTFDARMRNGYSAREAGRLWDRWREAKARLREAEC